MYFVFANPERERQRECALPYLAAGAHPPAGTHADTLSHTHIPSLVGEDIFQRLTPGSPCMRRCGTPSPLSHRVCTLTDAPSAFPARRGRLRAGGGAPVAQVARAWVCFLDHPLPSPRFSSSFFRGWSLFDKGLRCLNGGQAPLLLCVGLR